MRKYLGLIIMVIILMITGCGTASKTATTKTDQTKPQGHNEFYFTQANGHPEKALIDVINSTKETLDIAIYSLTHPDIVAAIKEAQKRGVAVRIISDKIQSSGKTQDEALKLLGSAGIPMKINKHNGLMHLKVIIADKKVVTMGSYNYSQAASTSNDEVLMVIHEDAPAKSFSDQFERMWNDTKGFETLQKKIAQ